MSRRLERRTVRDLSAIRRRIRRGGIPHVPEEWFTREDDTPDTIFYHQPRLTLHIDEETADASRAYYAEVLPRRGEILDLMSSWRSHLPEEYPARVVGLGMNRSELEQNPQLDERVVHDLNEAPSLPFEDARFDAAVVAVSVQYLCHPIEVIRDLRRVLRPEASFHVLFSDRLFPTKAVAAWRALPRAADRARLVCAYFEAAGGWSDPEVIDRSPGGGADPLYVVRSRRAR